MIRGVSDNNDGRRGKRFFAAPSAKGQAEVIEDALRNANINPATVSYVEAHGTGKRVFFGGGGGGNPLRFRVLVFEI